MTLEHYIGRNYTKAEFCKHLGVSEPTLNKYIKDTGKMPITIAERFCELTVANLEDLVFIVQSQRAKKNEDAGV